MRILLQQIHHLLHHPFGSENLVGLLWRDVVEDVLFLRLVEIVGQCFSFLTEELYGVIKHHLVEQVTIEMFLFPVLGVVASVAKETELFQCDAGHFLKD